MKKIISFIMALMITMSLTIPAFAANATDYLSNPEARSEYENQMTERDRLIAEKDALKAQFNKDNPGVSEYILNGVSFSSELFYDNFYNSLGIERWYTGYHGSGYYKLGGTVTVYANYQTYTAYQLLPDPKPQVTKTYLAKVAEINKKIKNAEDAADNASMQSLNEDIAMTQKITSRFYPDTEYNNSILLIFQIGNYMFASGNANYCMIGADHIIPNSREGAPYITNGHTMVPIRSVIEGLGGTVGWDPDLNGARCTLNGITIIMPIGSEYAYINGEPFKMTTPAIVKNGRTMIPIRFVAESLGYEVDYISDGAFVVIKQKKNAEIEGYDFSYPDYFEFDEDQRDWVGYEIYRYKDLDIGVRIVEADVYDPNFMDDITDEMSNDLEERQMTLRDDIKVFKDDEYHYYATYEFYKNYVSDWMLEFSIADNSNTDRYYENAMDFIMTALGTIEPYFE